MIQYILPADMEDARSISFLHIHRTNFSIDRQRIPYHFPTKRHVRYMYKIPSFLLTDKGYGTLFPTDRYEG
jgi:hypothetical protein